MLQAFLIVVSLVSIGILLQWLPYGTSFLKGFDTRYRYAYVVLFVREKPEFAGSRTLGEAIRFIEPADVLDSLYVLGTPAFRTWFAKNDAQDFFDDAKELIEPVSRTESETRLLIFAGSVMDLPVPGQTSGLALLRQISSLPIGKHSKSLVRWFPRMSSPAISVQEGAEAFGYLLAKTI